jgi:hypothetical protein
MGHAGALLVVGAGFLFCGIGTAEALTVPVPMNSTWKYEDSGTDHLTAWRDTTYDDGSWQDGPGILGYGEGYITTVVSYGGNASDKHRTTYFRIKFPLADDPVDINSMILRANYDDGFVAYLNGEEIARRSMPAGPITYDTFASSHESGSYETVDIGAAIALLVPGENLLAVEVHQTSMTSSDLAMDMELAYSSADAIVTRGPYLQVATDTSIVVRWRTDVPVTSAVRFGGDPASLTNTVEEMSPTTEHEIHIGPLTSETRYFYSVGTTDSSLAGGDSSYTFVTSPTPGTPKTSRVWIIGDSGTADIHAERVRNGFLSHNGGLLPDIWLMLGDNAYNSGTDAQYQGAVFDMYPRILRGSPLWPTRGNHDGIHSGINNDYYEIFTMPTAGEAGGLSSGSEAYYSFDYGEAHFICMDSHGSPRTPGSAMLDWLTNDLQMTNQKWIIAFWHHPPYTKGSHDSDNPADSGGRMEEMRENVLPILEEGGVDLVLCGHSHSYERSLLLDEHYGLSSTLHDSMKIDAGDGQIDGDGAYEKPTWGQGPHEGAVYVVAGSSGKISGGSLNHPVRVASMNLHGSVVLDIDGTQLNAAFLDSTGTDRDHFTIVKGALIAVEDAPAGGRMALGPNSPNPFWGETRISFALPVAGEARLALYDARGRLVSTLIEGNLGAGQHVAVWQGTDDAGRRVAPGVYFSVLEAGGELRTRKLILLD